MEITNAELIQYAIRGLQAQSAEIDATINALRAQSEPAPTKPAGPARRMRKISPEGIERIRAAQKKRWRNAGKAQKKGTK